MDSEFDELPVLSAGKRCGVQWAPWMGDWFTSWSPRNSNNNAEGPWDHWVDLAIAILKDPLTKIVRPEVHAIAQTLPAPLDLYAGSARGLTDDELNTRLRPAPPGEPAALPHGLDPGQVC